MKGERAKVFIVRPLCKGVQDGGHLGQALACAYLGVFGGRPPRGRRRSHHGGLIHLTRCGPAQFSPEDGAGGPRFMAVNSQPGYKAHVCHQLLDRTQGFHLLRFALEQQGKPFPGTICCLGVETRAGRFKRLANGRQLPFGEPGFSALRQNVELFSKTWRLGVAGWVAGHAGRLARHRIRPMPGVGAGPLCAISGGPGFGVMTFMDTFDCASTVRIRTTVPDDSVILLPQCGRTEAVERLQEVLGRHRDQRAPLFCMCRNPPHGVRMVASFCPGGAHTGRYTLRCHDGEEDWHEPDCPLRLCDPDRERRSDGSSSTAPPDSLDALVRSFLDASGLCLWRPAFEGRRKPWRLLFDGARHINVEGVDVSAPVLAPKFAAEVAARAPVSSALCLGLFEGYFPTKNGNGWHVDLVSGLRVFVPEAVFRDWAPISEVGICWFGAWTTIQPSRTGDGAFLAANQVALIPATEEGIPARNHVHLWLLNHLVRHRFHFSVPTGDQGPFFGNPPLAVLWDPVPPLAVALAGSRRPWKLPPSMREWVWDPAVAPWFAPPLRDPALGFRAP